jgi:hypothetical protein
VADVAEMLGEHGSGAELGDTSHTVGETGAYDTSGA